MFTSTENDLNNLLKKADSSPTKIRKLLQEMRGIGKVGTDIFFDAAQGIWPSLAPFGDPRTMETAKRCGLGKDVSAMWDAVGNQNVQIEFSTYHGTVGEAREEISVISVSASVNCPYSFH